MDGAAAAKGFSLFWHPFSQPSSFSLLLNDDKLIMIRQANNDSTKYSVFLYLFIVDTSVWGGKRQGNLKAEAQFARIAGGWEMVKPKIVQQ